MKPRFLNHGIEGLSQGGVVLWALRCLRSRGFTPLWSGFGTGTGQGAVCLKVLSVSCRRWFSPGTLVSPISGNDITVKPTVMSLPLSPTKPNRSTGAIQPVW